MISELLTSSAAAHSDNGTPWLFLIIAPLFIILGIVFLVKPQLQWKMNRWAYKNPEALEPSSKGLAMTRITGAGMILVATIGIIVTLTKM